MAEGKIRVPTDSLSAAGWKMASGGVICGGLVAALTCVILALVVTGSASISCGIGALAGLIALGGSQVLLILVEKLPPQITLLTALVAMALAAVGLFIILSWAKTSSTINVKWILVGISIACLGYLIGAKVAHSRVRLLHYSEQESAKMSKNS
ncbi:MAG: hypothetical protein FWG15_00630 [Propionibacteriaceae bacterium]|nr:hypothetical protein [Propionibacteriaceae bacterium]